MGVTNLLSLHLMTFIISSLVCKCYYILVNAHSLETKHICPFIGGDQMTAARARGSQRIRSNSERGKDRLEGLQPVVEDWHAKVCLLGVSNSTHIV